MSGLPSNALTTPPTGTVPRIASPAAVILLAWFLAGCGIDVELVPGSSKTTVRDRPALTAIHRIALVKFDLAPALGGEGNDRTVGASAVRAAYQAKLNELLKSQEFSALALSPEAVDNSAAYQEYLKEWLSKQPAPPPVPGTEKLGTLPSPLSPVRPGGPPAADICGKLGVDALLMVSAKFDTRAEVNLNALVVNTDGELVGKTGRFLWSYTGEDKLGVNVGNINQYTIASATESAAKRLMRSLAKDIRGD